MSAMPGTTSRTGGFGVVLGLLVLSLVVGAILPTRLAGVASATLGLALWLGVGRAAGLGRQARRAGVAVFCVLVGLAVVAYGTDATALSATADALMAAAVASLAVVIAHALLRERTVTLSTVAAVLSVYLLIGLFFAHAYLALLEVNGTAFIGTGDSPERFDLIYFSFVALTTVGFGDIAPVADLARALAVTEAVLGQLFLVTIVARVVSLIGQERVRRG